MRFKLFSALFFLFFVQNGTIMAQAPFTVKTDLFDQTQTTNLGLTKPDRVETFTVFAPSAATDHFSNGVVMTGFKDMLYCQWQSSAANEDATDTWVAYSRSSDGKTWTTPMVLSPKRTDGYSSSGGWLVNQDTLVAYINVWPATLSPEGGNTYYRQSVDGITWSELKEVKMATGTALKGIFEQDPHVLSDGRIINAAHLQPGLMAAPIYTDDCSGVRGWKRATYTNMTTTGTTSREMEPSSFVRKDGGIVMVFRDQNSTFRRLASLSTDKGQTWSTTVVTDMPDSRSKQSAGNLSDGTAYLVGNPVTNKLRQPLAIALSKDGMNFDKAYVLREGGSDLQAQRYSGTSKGLGYIYPKSMVWKDYLYVSYSTNKEDVQFTRIPLVGISLNAPSAVDDIQSENNEIQIYITSQRVIHITQITLDSEAVICLLNINGQTLYRQRMLNKEVCFDMKNRPDGIYIVSITTHLSHISKLFNIL